MSPGKKQILSVKVSGSYEAQGTRGHQEPSSVLQEGTCSGASPGGHEFWAQP